MPLIPVPKSGCSGLFAPIAAMYVSDFGSTGSWEISAFHRLSFGKTVWLAKIWLAEPADAVALSSAKERLPRPTTAPVIARTLWSFIDAFAAMVGGEEIGRFFG